MEGDKFSCKNCSYKWSNKRLVDPNTCPGCNSSMISNETEESKDLLKREDIDIVEPENPDDRDLNNLPEEED